MTQPAAEALLAQSNAAHMQDGARPVLSVIVPFYHDNPIGLLRALDTEAAHLGGGIELIVYDDGSGDAALSVEVAACVEAMALPVLHLTATANMGRARGRNLAASHAQGAWVLFLDSDMLPDRPQFLATWLGLAESAEAAVMFGGYSHHKTPVTRTTALHHYLADRSECVPASQRNLAPARYLCTSNLMVRADVFARHPFDEGFQGWGWEDVEWALRIEPHHPILHVDNTASHLGLDAPDLLMRKYRQSAQNYARVAARHPQAMGMFQSFHAARMLRRAGPLRQPLGAACAALARAECGVPLPLRALALKVYRANLYSRVIS